MRSWRTSRFVYCAYFSISINSGIRFRASRVEGLAHELRTETKMKMRCGGLLRPGCLFPNLTLRISRTLYSTPNSSVLRFPIRCFLTRSIEPPIRRLFGPKKSFPFARSDYGRGNGFTGPSVSQAFWFREPLCEFWVLHLPFALQCAGRTGGGFSRGPNMSSFIGVAIG